MGFSLRSWSDHRTDDSGAGPGWTRRPEGRAGECVGQRCRRTSRRRRRGPTAASAARAGWAGRRAGTGRRLLVGEPVADGDGDLPHRAGPGVRPDRTAPPPAHGTTTTPGVGHTAGDEAVDRQLDHGPRAGRRLGLGGGGHTSDRGTAAPGCGAGRRRREAAGTSTSRTTRRWSPQVSSTRTTKGSGGLTGGLSNQSPRGVDPSRRCADRKSGEADDALGVTVEAVTTRSGRSTARRWRRRPRARRTVARSVSCRARPARRTTCSSGTRVAPGQRAHGSALMRPPSSGLVVEVALQDRPLGERPVRLRARPGPCRPPTAGSPRAGHPRGGSNRRAAAGWRRARRSLGPTTSGTARFSTAATAPVVVDGPHAPAQQLELALGREPHAVTTKSTSNGRGRRRRAWAAPPSAGCRSRRPVHVHGDPELEGPFVQSSARMSDVSIVSGRTDHGPRHPPAG